MRWVTGITLNNYRAFPGAYPSIAIPAKHHVLIYGENGSGKSSVYNAVRDFFNSSANPSKTFEINYFQNIAGNNTGSVELQISELDAGGNITAQNPFLFCEPDAGSTHRVPPIQLANKVKGFLDYKRLLQTHFIETPSGQNPNLFPLIVEDLLAEHLINSVAGGVATVELQTEWIKIRAHILNLDGRYYDHKQALISLPIFEQNLRTLLTIVFTEFRRIIQTYFDPKLAIDVTFSPMNWDRLRWNLPREIYLRIRYAGQPITAYQTFLNEARLSAMAISIYLAALKTYPPAASDLKILYLDDVFIGLDTNNRIPLLKIIKDEFINHNFQVFISTYDRHWFETSRSWFESENCQLKCLELFINDDNNPATPDTPVIIDPSKNYFEKAKAYFESKDFPAAANYLRKTCESELRRILPGNLKLTVNHQTNEVELISKLETLVTNFENFLTKNNLNSVPFQHFKTYKKILLNPLSHDDLLAPHYRKKIQDGIALVQELQKLKTKEIIFAPINAVNPMKLGMRDVLSRVMHIYEIRVLENLQIIQQDTSPLQLSIVECEVTLTGNKRKFVNFQAAFDQLWIERGNVAPANNNAFHTNIKISNKRHLIDLMTF